MDLKLPSTLDDVARRVAQLAILNVNEAKIESDLRASLTIYCESASAMRYAASVIGGCVPFSTILRVYAGLGKSIHADVEELTAIHAAHRLLLGHRVQILVSRQFNGALVHVYGSDVDMTPTDPLLGTAYGNRDFDAAVFHGMKRPPRSYYESAEIVSVPIAFVL